MKLAFLLVISVVLLAQSKDGFPRKLSSGTTVPATCTIGETFFDTDATAGQNLYGCTASNTWTLQAGGGGGVASVASGLSNTIAITGTSTNPIFDYDSTRVPTFAGTSNWTGVSNHTGATSTAPFKTGTSDPASCGVGEFFFRTDTNTLKKCPTLNTWETVGGGTSYITLPFWASNSGGNPADATTYYVGCLGREIEAAAGSRPCFVPIASTLIAVYTGAYQFGTGSAETSTVYIRKNDTTDTTVCSTFVNNSARTTCNATGLSVSYSAGDFFEIKWVTPTWASNPTALGFQGVALFSVP